MAATIVKDPHFPLKVSSVTAVKNTSKIAALASDADVVLTKNGGDVVAYLVNPGHYESMVNTLVELGDAVTAGFLSRYSAANDGLDRLDASYRSSIQGEWASPEEEAEVFGE